VGRTVDLEDATWSNTIGHVRINHRERPGDAASR
jgi:hypothetical protein